MVPVPRRENWILPAGLFFATIVTTTLAGSALALDFQRRLPPFQSDDWWQWLAADPARLLTGLPFSVAVLSILLAHEFGHYWVSLRRGVDASPPYFLPAPTPIGTFGAFIRLRSPVYQPRILFDIAAAGPIAGFVVAVPALLAGIGLSAVVPNVEPQPVFTFPPLMQMAVRWIWPEVARQDLLLHPVAYGAWVGLFGTALNLLPIGQLDGGKLVAAVSEKAHLWTSRLLIAGLAAFGIYAGFYSWMVLALVLLFTPPQPPLLRREPLGRLRLAAALACLLIFLLTFTAVPIRLG